MPFPVDYGTGVVTGTFTDTSGGPVAGTISFTPSASRLLGTGAVILGDPVIVELDEEGSISATLPASDDPNVNPTDFTYRVDETFVGVVGSTYFIDVLEGTTLDLSDVAVPGVVNNGTVIWADGLPSQAGNAGEYLTTNGTTASWGPATVDGYLYTDVSVHARTTSGLYPAVETDPINDTAAWVSAGGPAAFHVETGDRVAIRNDLDSTTNGIYDWDGTTFTRAADCSTVASLHRKLTTALTWRSHSNASELAAPVAVMAMWFASDPDGDLGDVTWTASAFNDTVSTIGHVMLLASTIVSSGGGALASRTISAGTGLTGGGDLSADRTISADFGTGAGKITEGNDARLSDSRAPTGHKTSHATGGSDALAPSDIGAVPTSRQIAGLDLTADRDAAALRAALGLWTPIANETLGSASGSRTYDITGYRFVRITVAARSNRNGTLDTIRLRFNGDTGSNYSTNTNAFTTSVSAYDIAGESTNTDRSGYTVIQFGYMAGSWLTGTVMGTGPSSTATTAANSLSNGFAWKGATSAAPTSIEVYTAIGQFVAGSSFLVEGRT